MQIMKNSGNLHGVYGLVCTTVPSLLAFDSNTPYSYRRAARHVPPQGHSSSRSWRIGVPSGGAQTFGGSVCAPSIPFIHGPT